MKIDKRMPSPVIFRISHQLPVFYYSLPTIFKIVPMIFGNGRDDFKNGWDNFTALIGTY